MSGKNVGVVLSGCGFLDGAEIHEATLTLLALDRAGAKARIFAPAVDQMHVVDHLAQKPTGEKRNVLAESARIARGAVEDLAKARAADLDALIFPGGYGVAKNLSTFAVDGADLKVRPDVERLIRDCHAAGKPMGFICIAPVLAAKVLGSKGVKLTIGSDKDTAATLQGLGAKHVDCEVTDVVVDEIHKVASTPAYMLGPSIAPVATGIERLVAKVLQWA
jgi:enhancing lycopene biosynthesis protein 2